MKVIKIMYYLVFVFCFSLCSFLGLNCVQKFNNIVNIFHHAGINSLSNDNELHLTNKALDYSLELGNLVFYFEDKPVVNFVPEREKNINMTGMASKIFIFPYAQVKDEKLFKKTNTETGCGYKLKIERVSSPIKGIKVTFFYDVNTISFDYKFFDSIGNYKGVVFNFYNKNLIEKLKSLDDKILKTVDGKKKIVIVDLGHGGSDFGAISKSGLNEKDVTLSIGYKVEKILKKKGFDVFLTRDCDKTVLLDERTSFANNFSEDKILLSIHANSALNTGASGLETFFLDNSLFQDNDFSYGKECRENIKIIENNKSIRSKNSFLLASNLHENVYNFIKQASSKYKDRGVKKSVSQLLLGSHMPAALIEVGFLSNDKDLDFLQLLENQETVANGICEGVVEYFDNKVK